MRKKSIASTAQKKTKKKLTEKMISGPIMVIKHSGLMETGNSEILSIQSKRSSSMIRVKVPDESPLQYSRASSSNLSRFDSAQSSSGDSYDTVDARLDRLQRELDDTRRMRRHLSNASGYTRRSGSSSGSTSSSSFFYRQNSLLRSKSFISLTSQVLSTHEDHPEVIKRSDLFTRKSLRYGLGHMTHPPSSGRIFRLDREMDGKERNSENSVEFVNSWSEYLRRAIAVRVALRKELKRSNTVEETEWQQQGLNSLEEDEEETVSSYIGETETVSSFNTSSSDRSRQATQNSSTDMRLPGRNESAFTGSSSRGGGSNSQQSTPTQQNQDTGRQHSVLIPHVEEELSPGQKEFFVNDNGEVISITPVSMATPKRGKILTASAVRLALMQGTLVESRYSGLTGQMDSDMIEPTTQAWKQTCNLSSHSSQSLHADAANPKRQRSKSISSISTGSSAPIPVPERSQRRVVSEQYSKESTLGLRTALSAAGGSTALDEDNTAFHTPTAVSDGSSEFSVMTPLQKTMQKNPRPITLSSEGSSTVGSGGTRDSIYYVLDSQRRGLYDDHHPSQQQQQKLLLPRPMLTTHEENAKIPRMQSGSKADRKQQEAAAAAAIIAPTVLIPQRRQQRNSVSSNSSAASVVSLSRGKRNKPNKPRRRLSADSNVSSSTRSSSSSNGINYPNVVGTLEIDDPRRLNTTWVAL
jgi:hypothetical protein